ncbi:MAG: aminotransferase DegT [Omnitrophica WOR_2 bacterium RIFCSPLOWO2_12_FULL_50_9]|nr:MAG: aminotransferase DegT [Omnitrophica WOR_2 bacterium RIFCSPHIGHO2_02_FULL_50_17]OGX40855.1 MAG: aminotransferase DegT [Omnitrophica WOR_2 bacterium RIFCSPLOWO2_12_FULL_50_9]
MKINTNKSGTLSAKAKFRVPFGTVSITEEAHRLINEAVESKWLTRGKYVQEFEEKFARLFGVKEAVAVSSGTDADALSCAVLYDYGAKRGDEVIVPALSFVATGNAVFQAGLTPVFVDVRRETLNIDFDKIEEAVTPRTRAIMPVHLMGKPAEMDKISEIAKRHRLFVIEDAAEAHGAEYKERKIGSLGDMAAFSLYAAHIVTTIEGGVVITDNPQTADILRSLRNHGIVGKFEFRRIGFSAKMNELEAAVGLGNIRIFHEILQKRRRNLRYLIDKFKKFEEYFITLKEEPYEKIGPHAFSIIVKENTGFTKDEFVRYIEGEGIDSRNLFYSIPTQCPSYAFLGKKLGDFPEAEYCSDHGTHIGIHQDIELKDLDYVAEVTADFLKSQGLKC